MLVAVPLLSFISFLFAKHNVEMKKKEIKATSVFAVHRGPNNFPTCLLDIHYFKRQHKPKIMMHVLSAGEINCSMEKHSLVQK